MQSKLSKLIDNLSGIAKIDCIACKERKKPVCKLIELKKNKLLYKCKECKKTISIPIPEYKLIKIFRSANKFCNGDPKRFFLLLTKGIYTYEYMDSSEKFNEISLTDKVAFYSKLN